MQTLVQNMVLDEMKSNRKHFLLILANKKEAKKGPCLQNLMDFSSPHTSLMAQIR